MTDYTLRKVEATNSIRFFNGTNTEERNEVLRISREGIWANPDMPVDDAAKLVLKALENMLGTMIAAAVKEENEACEKIADAYASCEGIAQKIAEEIRARRNT